MNQILYERNIISKKVKLLFKMQFYFSFICIIVLFLYWLNINKKENVNKYLSSIISVNAKLNTVFNSKENDIYFGKLSIEKINLDYFVYNNCSEELLKLLPCKYSGPKLGDDGNICILGHNYLDGNFFSNIDKLEVNDEIVIEGFDDKIYKYKVYEKLEINKSNIEEIVNSKRQGRVLTLCTCTLDKNIRFLIRAEMFEKIDIVGEE